MNPRISIVKALPDFFLLLEFTNGEIRKFDVKPYMEFGIFKELRNWEVFNSVKVIDGSIQWCNEADFCPDTLYLESVLVENMELAEI